MTVRYIDAHSHLQFEQFAEDRGALIEQMRVQGIAGVVVGVDLITSRGAFALTEDAEHLYASVGLHPNHAGLEYFDEAAYRALAAHPKVVAIGECGLDFFRLDGDKLEQKQVQKELLQKHIELAVGANKPLIIHCRPTKGTTDAYQDLIEILKEAKATHPTLRGDIHFFVGGVEESKALIALNFTVSFTAVITFARDYDDVIRSVPLKYILSETDAPYLAPLTRRGERNDPIAVIDVVEKIAEIRGENTETVRTALLENARRVFALPG
ncbi:MAG: TatD family hydrolase [Candidatus Pacebacteria bacterium]|nr:TatD family hydrolase [Candidatus Paceibacterota bacterium]